MVLPSTAQSLMVIYKKIKDLKPYVNNSRTHSNEQINQIMASIKEFGFTNPLLIDDEGIIAGHGRLMAAEKLKMDEVPTITLSGLSKVQRQAYILADNQLALNAGWDEKLLHDELTKLLDLDFNIDLIGFDDDFLADLLAEETEGLTDEDEVPEIEEEPVSKLGDIWILGDHHLMCGDSTSKDDVEKLMGGRKADMVFTDPPYNINFIGTMGCTSKDGKIVTMKDGYKVPNSQYKDIQNDNEDKADFTSFIEDIIFNIKNYCIGGWYICFSSSTLNELLAPLVEHDMKWKSIITWNKNQSPMGGGHFRKKYEPIVYGYFNNLFYGIKYSEDDVWDIKRTIKNDLHPTMKPIELVCKAIGYSSNAGGVVLDLFGGSGSTMIASERLGRKNYSMELDERYVDVILKRYIAFVGSNGKVMLSNDEGEDIPYEEVCKMRRKEDI